MHTNDEFYLPHEWTEILALINKNREGSISDNEQVLLDKWIDRSIENKKLFEKLMNPDLVIERMKHYADIINWSALEKDKVLPRSEVHLTDESGTRVSKVKLLRRLAVAASILVTISIGVYYLLNTSASEKPEVVVTKEQPNEVGQPARHKATLTLSNGQVLVLDKSNAGVLAKESGSEIMSKDGQLIYKNANGASGVEPLFNTLTTGFGETFSTVLEDGTTIWLNAGSSVRYPLAFGDERIVELEYGEAYLEVAQNKRHFVLKGDHGRIQVLGTHFNVRSYPDEPAVITSLLEGKIKLEHNNNEAVILVPGKQSVFNTSSKRLTVGTGDVDGAASWVHGVLHFDNSNLSEVLRELGRWYSAEIEYRTNSNAVIRGDIDRTIPLSELLDELAKIAHVKFKIEGKKIIVLP
jgi:transmembrane sensor